jgi:hypothetical protein
MQNIIEQIAKFQTVRSIEDLALIPIAKNTFYIIKNEHQFFFDINDDKRISFATTVILDTDVGRLELKPDESEIIEGKLYFIKETNRLFIYNEEWICINEAQIPQSVMDLLIKLVKETIEKEMDIKLEQTKQEIWGTTLTYDDIQEIKAILNN